MTYKLRDLETLQAQVLLTGDFSVGRGENMDILIDSDSVSRHHAYIHNSENGVWIMDAGSTNGTRVGEKVAREWVMVEPGDIIMLGSTGFRLEHEIVGDDSLEGQLPPQPAPINLVPIGIGPSVASSPHADTAPVVPAPAKGTNGAKSSGGLIPPVAPGLMSQKPNVPRIQLPANDDPTEATIVLPQIKLEEAKREVDRLVQRANEMAQSRRIELEGSPPPAATKPAASTPSGIQNAQTDGIKLPQTPRPAASQLPANTNVRRDTSEGASKVKTDGIDGLRVRTAGKSPSQIPPPRKLADKAEKITSTPKSTPIRAGAPRPAAIQDPAPPASEVLPKPTMSPAAMPAAQRASLPAAGLAPASQPPLAVLPAHPGPQAKGSEWRHIAFLFIGITIGFMIGTLFGFFVLQH